MPAASVPTSGQQSWTAKPIGQCARGLERPLLCAIGSIPRPLQRRQHPATTRRRARGYRDRPPGSTQPRPFSPRSRLPLVAPFYEASSPTPTCSSAKRRTRHSTALGRHQHAVVDAGFDHHFGHQRLLDFGWKCCCTSASPRPVRGKPAAPGAALSAPSCTFCFICAICQKRTKDFTF